MPTIFSHQTTISGLIRNDNNSLSSQLKLELSVEVRRSLNRFRYGEFDFFGSSMQNSSIAPISTSNNPNSVGIYEKIATFDFHGSLPKPESVILIDDLDINVVDSQNYVTVFQEVEVEGSYWS